MCRSIRLVHTDKNKIGNVCFLSLMYASCLEINETLNSNVLDLFGIFEVINHVVLFCLYMLILLIN